MDVEKLIEQLNGYFEGEKLRRGAALDAATALSTLQAENEKLRAELKSKVDLVFQQAKELDRRHLLLQEQEAELEQVKQERDAAVGDMEALMWYSGEGCQICANAVEVHKRPYVRLDCKLGSGIDCKPKWRGQKEG